MILLENKLYELCQHALYVNIDLIVENKYTEVSYYDSVAICMYTGLTIYQKYCDIGQYCYMYFCSLMNDGRVDLMEDLLSKLISRKCNVDVLLKNAFKYYLGCSPNNNLHVIECIYYAASEPEIFDFTYLIASSADDFEARKRVLEWALDYSRMKVHERICNWEYIYYDSLMKRVRFGFISGDDDVMRKLNLYINVNRYNLDWSNYIDSDESDDSDDEYSNEYYYVDKCRIYNIGNFECSESTYYSEKGKYELDNLGYYKTTYGVYLTLGDFYINIDGLYVDIEKMEKVSESEYHKEIYDDHDYYYLDIMD